MSGTAGDRSASNTSASDQSASNASAADLIDPAALTAWLDSQSLAPGQELTCTPLAGGRSNAMFEIRRGDRHWVLRRPPGVATARADEGLVREYRILSALTDTGVPHPKAVALCTDPAVLGRTFHLMERVGGFTPLPSAIPAHLDTDRGRRAIGLDRHHRRPPPRPRRVPAHLV